VERYIDTPAKRYSSGMTVRLGFAIAAHLDPEILVVDEVLAVGDAEFQKKAIGKMQDVSKGEGRTVLFVSHNMTAVKNLCKTGVMLQNGYVKYSGDINSVVDYYLQDDSVRGLKNNEWEKENAPGTDIVKVKSAYVVSEQNYITVKTPFKIVTEFWVENEGFPLNVSMVLWDKDQNCVFNVFTENMPLNKGLHKAEFLIPEDLMNDGYYTVQNYFVTNSKPHFIHNNANSFEVVEERDSSGWHGKWIGAVRPEFIIKKLY
jgi:lipopolysaccharide transport system ATP-binding protein